ncbi:MAG: hypothetical protein WKF66_10215 [Pedobacter sp.]
MNGLILREAYNRTYKNTPFEAVLTDNNTLVVSESSIKGEGIRKDPKLDFFKNLRLARKKA